MPRWLRVVGTGFSFAVFGLLGLTLALVVFPLLRLLPGAREQRELRAQRAVRQTFRIFVRMTVALGILDYEVHGLEKVAGTGPLVVVANHPTLLDVVFLGALFPQLDVVVKEDATENPFMRGVIRATGYVSNRDPVEVVSICAERIRVGRSVLLFPEGTRSPVRDLQPFRRGAARIALAAGAPILPICIDCDPPTLKRGQPWYDVPDRPMHFTIELADPLDPAALAPPGTTRGVAARRVTAALRDFYWKKLQTLAARRDLDAVEA